MAGFVDFEYRDGTSDTDGISSINAGSNAGRFGVIAAMLNTSVSVSTLTWGGASVLPALDSGAGANAAMNVFGYGASGLPSGASAIALSMPPAGQQHCVLAATFDGMASIVSADVVHTGGTPSHPSVSGVATQVGDIVVLMGNDLGVYDATITGTGGSVVMAGSGYFIGLYKVADDTTTTVGGTFSGGPHNWQGVVFVLTPTGGGGTAAGLSTETDAALALAGKQLRAAGLAIETDTALALVTMAGLPFNTSAYEFGQRTGLDVADFAIYASTALNVSVYAEADVLLASKLFSYTESTGTDGRLTRKNHASLTAGSWYIFVAVTTGGAMVAAGRIQAT